MASVNIIDRTDIEYEARDATTGKLMAVVTYQDKYQPRPFRLEFMDWVPNVSTSYHASMDRVHVVLDAVHEHMI